MTISWDKVKYFSREEFDDPMFPGSGEFINPILLMTLDKLRRFASCPIIIHTSVGGAVDLHGTHGHSKNSYHLKRNGCKAVDFHFKTGASLREQFNWVERMGFGGVGIYPDWNNPGFHVDLRPLAETERWIKSEGVYVYFLGSRLEGMNSSKGSNFEHLGGNSKGKEVKEDESLVIGKINSGTFKNAYSRVVERIRRLCSRLG